MVNIFDKDMAFRPVEEDGKSIILFKADITTTEKKGGEGDGITYIFHFTISRFANVISFFCFRINDNKAICGFCKLCVIISQGYYLRRRKYIYLIFQKKEMLRCHPKFLRDSHGLEHI